MTSRSRSAADKLRRLIEAKSLLLVPVAHDPVSAWLSEMAGYEAVMVSRSAIATSVLASEEAELVDDELLIRATIEILRLVSIPVIVDLTPSSTGTRLRRTAAALVMSGAAALVVDDSHPYREAEVVDVDELSGRLEDARQAAELRRLPLLVIARTVAIVRGATSPVGALGRIASLDPSPDLCIVSGLDGNDVRLPGSIRVPLMFEDHGRVGNDVRVRHAERAGFGALVWTQPLASVAVESMRQALNALNESREPGSDDE